MNPRIVAELDALQAEADAPGCLRAGIETTCFRS